MFFSSKRVQFVTQQLNFYILKANLNKILFKKNHIYSICIKIFKLCLDVFEGSFTSSTCRRISGTIFSQEGGQHLHVQWEGEELENFLHADAITE